MGAAPLTPGWHAERTPNAPAIIMGATGETASYAELEDRSSRLARVLRARGLGEGDTIAICMENNRAYLEIAWAAQRAQAQVHGDQFPPAPGRGAVRAGRLRRDSALLIGAAGR